jgi:hypothetical protein
VFDGWGGLSMKKQRNYIQYLGWLGIVVGLIFFISACNKPARRLALSASASPTHSPVPTYTFIASPSPTSTKTPIPTPTATRTPTLTPTRTPKPSRTPTPTSTITRWVATDIPWVPGPPTPLSTPSSAAVDYQLKAWSEADALDLVETAEQFSFADNFLVSRGLYQMDQAAIGLAAQEALHRFPEASFKEKLEWRIALADTIQNSSASDAWILQQIEDSLNRGKVSPDNLNALLNPFGFQIGEQQDAPNLFGDGRLAQVLWITRLDWGYTGLYAALRQDEQGFYRLVKIYSTWNFNFGFDGWYPEDSHDYIRIEDHTGDGVPEVILHKGYQNGTFCGYFLLIFQWGFNQFIQADQNQFDIDRCNAGTVWQYGTPDENGAEPIEIWRSVSLGLEVIQYQRYKWNGEVYTLVESRLVAPDEFSEDAANSLIFAMGEEDYGAVVEKVAQYLASESQREKMKTLFGPSYPDYMRFQLGLAYAFQSDVDQARATFKQIVQTPSNPLTTTLSKAAQVYIDNYNGNADLYKACQAALTVMEKSTGVHPFGSDVVDNEHLLSAWGYHPVWTRYSVALCNLNAAMDILASRLDGAHFAAIPEQLKQAGVLIRSTTKVDLDNDGQYEWVLLVDTPGDDAPVNIWILVKTPDGVVPIPLAAWYTKNFELPLEDADTAGLEVKMVLSPEGTAVDFIHIGKHLYVFQLDIAEESVIWAHWTEDGLVTYNVSSKNGSLELEITVNTEYCKYCTDIYRWEDDSFSPYYPQKEQANQAEVAFLADWKLDEAIPLLKTATQDTSYSGYPRLLYLLGLAYELTGDEVHAVQTYWTLWREHPESVYARLAKAKLELKN